jgi:hypothetical protein
VRGDAGQNVALPADENEGKSMSRRQGLRLNFVFRPLLTFKIGTMNEREASGTGRSWSTTVAREAAVSPDRQISD